MVDIANFSGTTNLCRFFGNGIPHEHAEATVAFQNLPHHLSVTRFENVQRKLPVRKQYHLWQGKKRELTNGYRRR
jgi:hypothetical protein